METKQLASELKIEQLKHSLDNATKSLNEFTILAEESDELREWAQGEITKYAMSMKTSKIDKDELGNFFNKPYVITAGKHEGEYYLCIPKFVDVQFGWLEKVTESYNIFLVNKYVDWLGGLPQALKDELKFADPLEVYLDGSHLVGGDVKKAHEKYGQFIKRKEKDGTLLIDKSRHFELLATLIKDGILPFVPKPIAKEDLIDRRCDFELRDYQQQAFDEFLKYSNIGAFFPPSTGKTWLGMWAMTHVKGPWLVTVSTLTLIEQWTERIEQWTDLEIGVDVDIMTYHGGIKTKKNYKGKIIDEVHHLPANEFSKLAIIPTEYSIGLSATPQREDSREEYIFALTGRPIGMDWQTFKRLGIITNPSLHVWIVKNDAERLNRVTALLQEEKKTIIFADSIEMGKTYSKRFNIPHIYGDTKQRLSKIQDNKVAIVSRVGDEGVSIPDIERVIEISWLHGSRRQELQRFTRLLHGKGTTGEGHTIMTVQEYQKDRKRLFGIMAKGFKIVLHREGISDKVIHQATNGDAKVRAAPTVNSKDLEDLASVHPLLALAGVQKSIARLPLLERKFLKVIYSDISRKWSKRVICAKAGFAGDINKLGGFKKLKNLTLIKEVGKKGNEILVQADLVLLGR